MLTVIIPSKTEKFLDNTIRSVLDNATGEIEVIVSLDGYDCPRIDDPRVRYIVLPPTKEMKKRQGVNEAVKIAKGEYIMCLDAHCMVGKGFDEILAKDCEDNWIVVPRRYKLNAETWTIQDDQPPVDYSYWMWRYLMGSRGSHGFPELHDYRWDERGAERKDIMIDDIMTHQGSAWFMKKSYFEKIGFEVKGYTGWGQESEELCLKTWTTGGRVVVNKNTWYAHLYKGKKWGRMYFMSKDQRDESMHYSYNYWVRERRDDFIKVINKFLPIPNFPPNWWEYLK
jgi:glycosyltransferase involved in cell wall biosynthesis